MAGRQKEDRVNGMKTTCHASFFHNTTKGPPDGKLRNDSTSFNILKPRPLNLLPDRIVSKDGGDPRFWFNNRGGRKKLILVYRLKSITCAPSFPRDFTPPSRSFHTSALKYRNTSSPPRWCTNPKNSAARIWTKNEAKTSALRRLILHSLSNVTLKQLNTRTPGK